jgi:hypothetical protein
VLDVIGTIERHVGPIKARRRGPGQAHRAVATGRLRRSNGGGGTASSMSSRAAPLTEQVSATSSGLSYAHDHRREWRTPNGPQFRSLHWGELKRAE